MGRIIITVGVKRPLPVSPHLLTLNASLSLLKVHITPEDRWNLLIIKMQQPPLLPPPRKAGRDGRK